jgi:hypothetical protein
MLGVCAIRRHVTVPTADGDEAVGEGALCVYVVMLWAAEWTTHALLRAALLQRTQTLERHAARGWAALWAKLACHERDNPEQSNSVREQRSRLRQLTQAARALRQRESRRAPAVSQTLLAQLVQGRPHLSSTDQRPHAAGPMEDQQEQVRDEAIFNCRALILWCTCNGVWRLRLLCWINAWQRGWVSHLYAVVTW